MPASSTTSVLQDCPPQPPARLLSVAAVLTPSLRLPSGQVDIWAAGVITYILLCGFPPFASAENNQEELFDRILSGEFEFTPPFWDEVSDAARELITAMLQVDPEARFSAEEVLIHPWIAVSAAPARAAAAAGGTDGGWRSRQAAKLGLWWELGPPAGGESGDCD